MLVSLEQAALQLKSGELVSLPTETVYGLAACIDLPDAIENIFTLKKRPQDNPLIVHVATLSQMIALVENFPPHFTDLAEKFWPGPLSFVLTAKHVPEQVRAGLLTVCVRMPDHPLTLSVIEKVGPIVMPSANLSGKPSATTPAHVEEDFGKSFPVLDGGGCEKGIESTILGYFEGQWRVLRLGSIPPEAFSPILGYEPTLSDRIVTPGQKHRHYSPSARLSLGNRPSCTVVVGYTDRKYPGQRLFALGSSQNPSEVSHHLYQVLRRLDQEGVVEACVDIDVPKDGLWKSILERLERASEE
ncbi:MAG: L-threonylcarbamoyladenylate synthase [Waddliaceae bacterium]